MRFFPHHCAWPHWEGERGAQWFAEVEGKLAMEGRLDLSSCLSQSWNPGVRGVQGPAAALAEPASGTSTLSRGAGRPGQGLRMGARVGTAAFLRGSNRGLLFWVGQLHGYHGLNYVPTNSCQSPHSQRDCTEKKRKR